MILSMQTFTTISRQSFRQLQLSGQASLPKGHHLSLQGQRHHLVKQARTSTLCAAATSSNEHSDDGSYTYAKATEVLQYWLGNDYAEALPNSFPKEKTKIWFFGGAQVDQDMSKRFGTLLRQAADTGLPNWNRKYNGLAAVLLMDQFSRNIYRGTPKMFALDSAAIAKAKALITSGDAASFPLTQQLWLIYPFMHSEKLQDQHMCASLVQQMLAECKQLEDADDVLNQLQQASKYAKSHLQVIKDWGRFPHRNKVLARTDTAEEQQGMANGSIPKFG